MFAYRCHEETASLNHQPRTREALGEVPFGGQSLATSVLAAKDVIAKIRRERIVQTAGLLFQRRSIRDAQSKWRVGAGPVAAAEIAEFSPGCALPLPASGR
jgi:hypothetical protein